MHFDRGWARTDATVRGVALIRHLVLGLALVSVPALAFACASEEDDPYLAVESWACFEAEAAGPGGQGGRSGAFGAGGAGGAEEPGVGRACDCYGIAEGEEVSDSRPSVAQCASSNVDSEGFGCCYAWPNEAGSYDCRCEDAPPGVDVDAATYCASAATASRGKVVPGCPPTPRDDAAYCAFHGESCAPEYLDEHLLNGCCEGFVCRPDAHGVPVCHGD